MQLLQVKAMLTRAAMIVQSSHQNGAAEIFLASKRAATAIVAATTQTMVPSHTFHAWLSSGGKDIAETVLPKDANVRRMKDRKIARFNRNGRQGVLTAGELSRCYRELSRSNLPH